MTLLRKENTICRVTDNLIKGDGCCHTPAQLLAPKAFWSLKMATMLTRHTRRFQWNSFHSWIKTLKILISSKQSELVLKCSGTCLYSEPSGFSRSWDLDFLFYIGTISFLISKYGNNVDKTHKVHKFLKKIKESRSKNLENPDVSKYRQIPEHLNTNSDC